MNTLVDICAVILLLLNFRLLSSSRIRPCIRVVAVQAVVLSIAAVAIHNTDITLRIVLIALVNIALKAFCFPWLLSRATRDTGFSRELTPVVGYNVSLFIGVAMLSCSFILSGIFTTALLKQNYLFLPIALFTVSVGLFIIIARTKAPTQVVGYIAMENGIYAFGLSFAVSEPLLVELGVLFDVFIAVLIMGIIIYQINQEFDHIDTNRLTALRD